MNTETRRFVPAKDVKTITVDDSLVLVDGKGGQYFGLNGIGAVIWHLLEEGCDENAIIDKIMDEYDVDKEVVAEDLQRILNELAEAGLVQIDARYSPSA